MPAIISVRFLSVLNLSTPNHECRQQELFTALLKTARHPGIEAIHLFVEHRRRLTRMASRLRFAMPHKVVRIVELGRMPLNSDFVYYATTTLQNRWVLVSNDDIYPEGDAWLRPPPSALLLSRHAKKVERTRCGVCDATRAQMRQSLCNNINTGSFDAWVANFSADVNPIGMDLVRTPRHAFGSDNLLGHAFETYFHKPLRNMCYSYRLFHIHCQFQTSVRRPVNASRGYGDRTFVTHHDMAMHLRRHVKISLMEAKKIVRRRWRAES